MFYTFKKKNIALDCSFILLLSYILSIFEEEIFLIDLVSTFFKNLPFFFRYNDIPLVYDKQIYDQLVDSKIDEFMAQHVAHLFIRDSISLFSEKIHQDDEKEMDHFEVKIFR